MSESSSASLAVDVVHRLIERGETVATAESLTGGLLCAALVDVPGASQAVRGAVVAYAPAVKTGLLGVDAELVAARGTVDDQTARAMAAAAREHLGATWGVATTGVAGPDPTEGKPVGTAYVAVASADDVSCEGIRLSGDRREIREETVRVALSGLVARLREEGPSAER